MVQSPQGDQETSLTSNMDKVQAQMINIANCDKAEFESNMISQYGEEQFKEGWCII